ncbi:MAG: hypothetical protein H0V17_30705 [Deltaproteobacteria bacterium]|nr:hypothetical protein [Deltaproteobacteria bacterium]
MAPPTPPAKKAAGVARILKIAVFAALRGAWLSTMVLTPLVGFWLASSVAAYSNASQWLSLLLGLALFPLVPVGWELVSVWRRSRQQAPGKQYLTRVDRLVLRTLIVNGLFLAVMLYASRTTAFRALSQRGDWMLDGHDGPIASTVRGFLLGIGDKLDGKKLADPDAQGESDAAPDPSTIREDNPLPLPVKPGGTEPPKTPIGWPLDDAPDAKVTAMPEHAKASIASVGAYLKKQFPDKKLRVKAIHDFVAMRLVYDKDTLEKIMRRDYLNVPSQEAEPVFAAKTGVCAGYAKLMTAIGAAANVEIKYVTGYIRDASRRIAAGSDESIKAALQGQSHAWNAVLLDGEWFLLDATWDDPIGSDKPVHSTYLFTPPRLFAYDHLPEDPAWQLVMKPISEGDFVRLPMMSPAIGRFGLSLESPNRSQVSVSGEVTITFDNPYGAHLLAEAHRDGGGGTAIECTETSGKKATVTCALPTGEFEVRMFAAPADGKYGRYAQIGSILVNSR